MSTVGTVKEEQGTRAGLPWLRLPRRAPPHQPEPRPYTLRGSPADEHRGAARGEFIREKRVHDNREY
ncbi:hypothetical protein COCON_G00117040 [Conger conger]|uniref:Uncharacterized protein n=1 Tax=Conger conger TaxID=82655 RepID=A0A9Q1HYE2_CONCO|nr:hypothetical protein COCON_G00117040 [Conger conger]